MATPLTGSEKLQQKRLEGTSAPQAKRTTTADYVTQWVPHTMGRKLLAQRGTCTSVAPSTSLSAKEDYPPSQKPSQTISQKTTKTPRTRADMGQVLAPSLKQVVRPSDHMVNAFIEYKAILEATKTVKMAQCTSILKAYKFQQEGLLSVKLEEAEATIYNNLTSNVIKGKKMSHHMVAYNATSGIVPLDEEETKRTGIITFQTPKDDPIVVTTQGTEIWLEDKILERAHLLSESDPLEYWEIPKTTWVNGVPGGGKTTWIIKNFNSDKDIVATTTTEAKRDLRERITQRAGADAAKKIRTIASLLANGVKDQERAQCTRLLVDEALMNHFGAIVMITRITGAQELLLIGDVNQLQYIDRENLFKVTYLRPNHLTNISQELLCTYRCPMDVAYALNEVYEGIYSASKVVKSIHLGTYSGALIPKTQPNTLYLTYTQAEKEILREQGYGKGKGSNTLTIHEAQGLDYESVILIKCINKKLQLHDSMSHAVVAISRHKRFFAYHADESDDALGYLAKRAATQNAKTIIDYNLKMAIHNRDETTMDRLGNQQRPSSPQPTTDQTQTINPGEGRT